MLENNTGKVKLVFKNFPLRRHKYAMEAAIAALAADKHGKFWKFHDQLFLEHNKLSDQKIREIARNLGFNSEEFEKMMKNQKVMAKIQKDILDGQQAGVTGTPTIFVNGRRLRDWSLNGLQMLIDKALEKM
ncbi:MAG: thioredoxin domain-containing protein [Deltaproteobacteria bacterium]|nr:thioredoxin domain-containing protein [Deltaproteobacteria bacterium]